MSEGVDTHAGPDISFSDELGPLQCTQPVVQPLVSKLSTETSPDVAFSTKLSTLLARLHSRFL